MCCVLHDTFSTTSMSPSFDYQPTHDLVRAGSGAPTLLTARCKSYGGGVTMHLGGVAGHIRSRSSYNFHWKLKFPLKIDRRNRWGRRTLYRNSPWNSYAVKFLTMPLKGSSLDKSPFGHLISEIKRRLEVRGLSLCKINREQNRGSRLSEYPWKNGS